MLYNWQNRKFAKKDLKTNEIHFLTRKNFNIFKKKEEYIFINNPFIRQVHWSITGKCNYKCKHCFLGNYTKNSKDLSLKSCLKLIDEFEKCGVMLITLTGGEPLLRTDILKIIDALSKKNIKIAEISTNGSLLTEKFLDKLISRKLYPEFCVSFDGLKTHDWLRNKEGSEKEVIKSLKLLTKKNFKTSATICIHKKNIKNLEKNINFLISIGVEKIFVNQVINSGNWQKEKEDILKTNFLYDAYLNYIPKYLKASSPVTLILGGFFFCEKNSKNFKILPKKFCNIKSADNKFVCDHAKETIYITSKGELLPCMPLAGIKTKIGRTFLGHKISLQDALVKSSYSEIINTKLKDLFKKNKRCKNCSKKFVCGGGCRASAASKNGNFMDCDENMCIFFEEKYDKKIQNAIEKLK